MARRGLLRRGTAAVLGLLTVAAGLVVVVATGTPAQAAWTAPAFVRSVAGNGRPGVYPWGAQYNPVSNEVLVGDYLNNQVRRYTPDGRLLGSFYRSNATGQPYSIAVDPRNGDIYVPEIADGQPNNKVAHYTKDGTFVRALTLNGIDYQAWITIDGAGNLVQSDSHYANTSTNRPQVRVWRLSDGKNTKSFTVWPAGTTSATVPRVYGIDVDSAGSFWLTDTFNNRILKYSAAGTHVATYGVGHFHGDARGMAVDEPRDRVYVSDPTVGQVQVFTTAGVFVESLGGGAGVGALNLGGARQPTVAPDGTLYVAEYGNARVHRFTADGTDDGFFPRPAQPAVPGQLGEPRDVDVDDQTGDIWVADSWNQRFQRFAATGEFVGTWGTRSASPEYGMNYPRGIAVDPTSRRVWVVNQRGHHIKRYEYDGTFVDRLGDAEVDSDAPGYFRWPLDVEFHGTRALVTDRNSSKVKILDAASGAELGSITRAGNHGGAIDPVTGNVFLADDTKVYVYDPTGATLLTTFGGAGTGNGQFRHIWDMVVSNGTLYVTDDLASRVQAFSTSGTFLGSWGGYGQGAYQFKNPSGIATDSAGLLYVADAGNDRVTVFDPARARGGAAWPPPTVTLGFPGQGATLPARPVRLSGTVADDSGVAGVQVAVRDEDTGLWFNAGNSSWATTVSWANSPLVGDTAKQMTWAWSFIGIEYAGRYHAEVRAVDAAGNTSPVRSVDFGLVPETTTDTLPPESLLSNPAAGGEVELEPPLVLTGDAADETGVQSVEVRVRKAGTGLFLQPDGSFGTATSWLPTALSEPATTSTAWSRSWASPEPGEYEVATRATDVLGQGQVQVVGGFRLTAVLPPDTTPLVLSGLAPAPGAVLAAGPVVVSGEATDDRAVGTVEVAVKDRTSGLWLRPDGSWGAFTWLPATLASPGAAATAWSRGWTAVAGSYGYQVRATDGAGNTTSQPFRSFTVS